MSDLIPRRSMFKKFAGAVAALVGVKAAPKYDPASVMAYASGVYWPPILDHIKWHESFMKPIDPKALEVLRRSYPPVTDGQSILSATFESSSPFVVPPFPQCQHEPIEIPEA